MTFMLVSYFAPMSVQSFLFLSVCLSVCLFKDNHLLFDVWASTSGTYHCYATLQLGLHIPLVGLQMLQVGLQSPQMGLQSPVVGLQMPEVGLLMPHEGIQMPYVGLQTPLVGL